jgi:hypothetical protein
MKSSVAALKQHFENLFPGKWVDADARQNTLLTGLNQIDHSLTKGIARQRITEWTGSSSSGKSTILRAVIKQWCLAGFDVAFIDAENKLVAADWTSINQDNSAASTPNMGKFWVIRNLESNATHSKNYLWAADELIRANAFDVVVLDVGTRSHRSSINSRVYARLQNSLGKSKSALVILQDIENHSVSEERTPSGWGSYAQLNFHWGSEINRVSGLHGTITIAPSINCEVIKDGITRDADVSVVSHVVNRLFTHAPVPDRRIPKVRQSTVSVVNR